MILQQHKLFVYFQVNTSKKHQPHTFQYHLAAMRLMISVDYCRTKNRTIWLVATVWLAMKIVWMCHPQLAIMVIICFIVDSAVKSAPYPRSKRTKNILSGVSGITRQLKNREMHGKFEKIGLVNVITFAIFGVVWLPLHSSQIISQEKLHIWFVKVDNLKYVFNWSIIFTTVLLNRINNLRTLFQIALRAAILEQENRILRVQISALSKELATLQQIVCGRSNMWIASVVGIKTTLKNARFDVFQS